MKSGDYMNKELKQKIDNAWIQSDFGKWCKAVAKMIFGQQTAF